MRAALMRFVCCAVALVLTIGHAGAQDAQDPDFPTQPPDGSSCSTFAGYWAQVADIALHKGCLPPGDQWTSDFNAQMKLCSGSYDNVTVEIAVRNHDMKFVTAGNCGACSVAVDLQLKYATGNQLYQCNFSSATDDRWNTSRAQEINICLGQFNGNDVPRVRQQYTTMIADMRASVEQCKLTHQPKGCQFSGCHSSNSSNSSSAVLTMPKSADFPRDAFKPFPSRTKPNAAAVEDPCKSGGRISNSRCKQSPTRAKESGGNPMDRLGDQNNSNLGTVSGNAGGAQIGRPATPTPTSPTTSAPPSADAVVRAPARSNAETGGFKSKPTFPTFNDPNTVR